MSWFGIGGNKHVEAPKRAKPPAPKAAVAAPAAQLADASAAKGFAAYKNGVKAAKTQPLAPLPWTGGLSAWLGGLKSNYITTYTKTFKEKTTDFIAKRGDALGPEGKTLLTKMANDGKFDKVDAKMSNLMNSVERFLDKGGRPALAVELLKQIDNPDAIKQVNDNTCVGATLQKALVEQSPAKYFRMMTNLCDEGNTHVGDVKIAISDDHRKDIMGSDMGLGDRASAYFQASVTEYANGKAKYDFNADKSTEDRGFFKKDKETRGVSFEKAKEINELLIGAPTIEPSGLKDFVTAAGGKGQSKESAVDEFVKRQTRAAHTDGHPGVFLTIQSDRHARAHMVLVRNVDEKGNFHVMDANGKERVWSPKKLAERVALSEEKNIGELTAMAGTATTSTTAAPIRRR